MSTLDRAVVTYDFSNISLTIYNPNATRISLTPNNAILLAQQLLTNALLCQSHIQHESSSAHTDTTPTSAVA